MDSEAARALVTGPAIEPVTLAEAKLHLRVDGVDEDTLISGLITAARQYVENLTRRALITQTWDVYYDDWPENDLFTLPLPPLQSVTSVTYTDDDDAATTFAASNYIVFTSGVKGQIRLQDESSWPSDDLREIAPIKVRIVAGYGLTTASIPEAIRRAMLVFIGQMYENREKVDTGVVDLMLWPYRVW